MFGFCISSEDDDTLTDSWGYLLSNFKVPFWVRGETYLNKREKEKLPDLPIILITPHTAKVKGVISLEQFEHPKDCIYWFGGSHEVVKDEPRNTTSKVYIPMQGEIHAPMAGAIVLWDRILKNG